MVQLNASGDEFVNEVGDTDPARNNLWEEFCVFDKDGNGIISVYFHFLKL